jgi:hypothetical protein
MSTLVSEEETGRHLLGALGDEVETGPRRSYPCNGIAMLPSRLGFSTGTGDAASVVRRTGLATALLLLWAAAQSGCDACSRKTRSTRKQVEPKQTPECSLAEDCADDNPCVEVDCVDERCVIEPLPAGTLCGEATRCEAAARCDGRGRCVAGEPVAIDDGNACTTDWCDPKRGVVHEPIPIDDSDACTTDACNPRTGKVTHEPVDIDDGDECTFDTCNPETGVSHARPEPKYTCETSCGPGYHASSRRLSAACGPERGVRTYCQPNCGPWFYACGASCPAGYRAGARRASRTCGPNAEPLTYCKREAAGQ